MLARAYWDKGAWARRDRERRPGDQAQAVERAGALVARRCAAPDGGGRARTRPCRSACTPMRARTIASFSTSRISRPASARSWRSTSSASASAAARHADRQGAYDSLRSAGFLGLCLSEQKVGNPLKAREYCQRALGHAPNDPIAYFLLGNVNRDLFNARQSCGYLKAARTSYARMLELNPHLDESRNAQELRRADRRLLPQAGVRSLMTAVRCRRDRSCRCARNAHQPAAARRRDRRRRRGQHHSAEDRGAAGRRSARSQQPAGVRRARDVFDRRRQGRDVRRRINADRRDQRGGPGRGDRADAVGRRRISDSSVGGVPGPGRDRDDRADQRADRRASGRGERGAVAPAVPRRAAADRRRRGGAAARGGGGGISATTIAVAGAAVAGGAVAATQIAGKAERA